MNLDTFIRKVEDSTSIDEERKTVTREMAEMRSKVREADTQQRASMIAKLIFLNIGGENTQWGQMEALSLMTVERPSYKSIGYIAASVLLDEANEIAILITQTVMKDLKSNNPNVVYMALTLISLIATPDMARTACPEIIKLLSSTNPRLQKAATSAAVRIVRKAPDVADDFKNIVPHLLNSEVHSVIITGINLVCAMIKNDNSLARPWYCFVKPFMELIIDLHENNAPKEFNLNFFNDPFLQIKIMEVLGLIGRQSEKIDDLLAKLVTDIDVKLNTGRSILLQAVKTIGQIALKPSLRTLAYNQVGRLFQFKDSNILYSALSAFSSILYAENYIINRSSSDSQALQRYKTQVVHCLNHKDPSIRRRALDVIAALIDETNAQVLVPEIMNYLHLADGDFRTELVAKVFAACQRFASSPKWNFNTILRLIVDSGNYVSSDVLTSFCQNIVHHPQLHRYAISQIISVLPENMNNQSLIQVGSWVLGEYQTIDTGTLELLAKLLKNPQTSEETSCYLISAITKLAVRFHQDDFAKQELLEASKSNSIVVQQRAGEMYRILWKPEVREDILAPMEVDEEIEQEEESVPAPAMIEPKIQQNKPKNKAAQQIEPEERRAQIKRDNSNDLLDLLDIEEPAPPSKSPSQQRQVRKAQREQEIMQSQQPQRQLPSLIEELSAPVQQQSQTQAPLIDMAPQLPPNAIEVLRKSDFTIYFEVQRNANNPNQVAIRSTIINNGQVPLTNFSVQYGVPVGWSLGAQPPSSNVLEPAGGNPIRQILMLQNRGSAPLRMRAQAQYLYRTQPLKEIGEMNQIF